MAVRAASAGLFRVDRRGRERTEISMLLRLIAGRLVQMLAILGVVSVIVHALIYFAPGTVVDNILGSRPVSEDVRLALMAKYNLDKSLPEQYFAWASNVLKGDLGQSVRSGEDVAKLILNRMPLTLELGVMAFLMVMVTAIPLGVLAALHPGTVADRGVTVLTTVGVSSPGFVTGIVLIYLLSSELGLFPLYGAGAPGIDRLYHLVLPAAALAFASLAIIANLTRVGVSRAMDSDWIEFERSRGHSRFRLVLHALRAAMVPVVTASGLILGLFITGAVLIEETFALPGAGRLFVDSVSFQDTPVVQSFVLVFAALIVLANLMSDIAMWVVDPAFRARWETK